MSKSIVRRMEHFQSIKHALKAALDDGYAVGLWIDHNDMQTLQIADTDDDLGTDEALVIMEDDA